MDDVRGGLSAIVDDPEAFGVHCRVEGVRADGKLHVLILDPVDDRCGQLLCFPPEQVYLQGTGTMELTFPEDYD